MLCTDNQHESSNHPFPSFQSHSPLGALTSRCTLQKQETKEMAIFRISPLASHVTENLACYYLDNRHGGRCVPITTCAQDSCITCTATQSPSRFSSHQLKTSEISVPTILVLI
jgi:hypothetical protein